MLHLQVYVQVDEIELVPTPENVLNEFDGVTAPLGIRRFTGEKSKYYKNYAHQITKLGFNSPEEQHRFLHLELRGEPEYAIFESTDIDNILVRSEVLNNFKLQLTTYTPGGGTSLYQSQQSTYDLLDRNTYPFLEELLAHASNNVSGLRTYISPLGHGRYNHILPYHLVPYQRNYEFNTGAILQGTSFFLPDRHILPDSLEIIQGNIPDNIYSSIKQVNGTSNLNLDTDFYINYWTGEVKVGSDFGKYETFISYESIDPSYRFTLTPGSTIFQYGSTDLLTRLNTLDNPNQSLETHRYQYGNGNIVEGYQYSGSRISPNIAFTIEEGDLISSNLNRWG